MSDNTSTADLKPRTADILYDAFYSGAVGGSVVGLFFLAIDVMNAQPLHTPSMLASVLFLGATPSEAMPVRLEMVALFALLHFATFAGVGLLVALAEQKFQLRKRRLGTAAIAFVLLNLAFFVGASLFMPGAVSALGAGYVVAANLLAAVGMTAAVAWGEARAAVKAAGGRRVGMPQYR